jgi:hypothetical protein
MQTDGMNGVEGDLYECDENTPDGSEDESSMNDM